MPSLNSAPRVALAQPIGQTVPVLPYLSDARTLSLPQGVLFLGLGWLIVLVLRDVHSLTKTGRSFALVSSFAFTMQTLFFAPLDSSYRFDPECST